MDKEAEKQKIEGYLAIFLGSFGAHNFYRGEIGAGILRIILGWGGIAILVSPLLTTIANMINGNIGSAIILTIIFTYIIIPIITLAPVISIITGIMEGIDILRKNNPKSSPGIGPGGGN